MSSGSGLSKYPARNISSQPSTPTTPKSFAQIAQDRKNAEILAQQLKRQAEIDRLSSEPLPAHSADPAEFLSTEEILALDLQNRRAAHIKEQGRRSLQTLGNWLVSNPEFPATPEAGAKLAEWCAARGVTPTWNNLDAAYKTLLANGEIVQNFTRANKQEHEVNADYLRANGIRIEPVDFTKMSKDDFEHFAASQPIAKLEHAFLTNPPESESEAAPPVKVAAPKDDDPYGAGELW